MIIGNSSHISGITMLGIPAEIYAFGTQFWLSFISALAVSNIMSRECYSMSIR